ncbi:MAG: hypothetical protein HKL99_11015 [Burkholderiales bacterium]|nr:hypothetical protein [Burkholderiales bacterium]
MSAVPDQTQVALQTVLNTAESMAPAAVGVGLGVASAANPNVALAIQLGMAALPLLQQSMALAQAGNADPAQVAALWANVNAIVQSGHNAWVAQNATAAATPAA